MKMNELTTLLRSTTITPVKRPTKHEDIIPELRIHSEEEEDEDETPSSTSPSLAILAIVRRDTKPPSY